MNFQIRRFQKSDRQIVKDTVGAAFEEAQSPEQENVELVINLLMDPTAEPRLALVALAAGQVVGFILFTNLQIENTDHQVAASILAPLAVHPDFQNQGIGGRLITEGIKELVKQEYDLVFVLGHPGYYSRFCFHPAGAEGYQPPFPLPSEHADAWMVQELRPGSIQKASGIVQCADALNDPRYW